MSEQAYAMGTQAPKHSISHKGKTYWCEPAFSNKTLAGLEATLFENDKRDLSEMEDVYPPEVYIQKLDELRAQRKAGYYKLHSKNTSAFLQTQEGALTLLRIMIDATEAELIELIVEKGSEITELLNEVVTATWGELEDRTKDPKQKARLKELKSKKPGK